MITVFVLIFVFLIALFLIVKIQLIIKLVRKQIEGIIGPLILAIIAGIGWIFITRIMVGTNSVINMIEPLLMTYLTFATLAIRWTKNNCSIIDKIITLKNPIYIGFVFSFIINALLVFIFFCVCY